MPQQRSRTRAVIPGKAILGVAGAAIADRKTLGGAVVPGRAILGDNAAQEQARMAEALKQKQQKDPKQETGPAKKEVKPDDSLPPLVKPGTKKNAPPKPKPALSEKEVLELLDADPEAWEHVLDLEAEREDGIRPAIAAAILALGDKVVETPIPEAALEALRTVALVEPPAAA